MQKARRTAAAVGIGGALVLAVPSVAGAAPAPGGKACTAVEKRVPVLESRQAKLQAQLTAAQSALANAEDAGKPAIVNRLEARVRNLQHGLDKVGNALNKIQQTCG